MQKKMERLWDADDREELSVGVEDRLEHRDGEVHLQVVGDFFFQAEDGIRGFHVTGVQTCALPIFAVDSFGPRGVSANCGGFGEQVADGYAALHYLASKSFIRSSHVAVLGFSMGGGSVLASLEKGLVERLYTERFRSGVAFYPAGCNSSSGIMMAPVLVLTGDADDWTPSAACEAMVAGRSEIGVSRAPGDRSLIELVIYPGAHHGFDLSDLSLVPSRGAI